MTTFALDTNIISYLIKGNKDISARIARETARGNEIVIPPIVYFEIKRGLLAIGATKQMQMFDKLCENTMVGELDRAVLDVAANTYATLRQAGQPVEDSDILIAAYCIRNVYTLVTNNVKHFEAIDGLKFVNWVS